MSKSGPSHELNYSAKDPKFDIDQIQHYSLCLQYSERDIEVCIIDQHKNLCLFIEKFKFTNCFTTDQRIAELEKIYDNHHLLQVGFWKNIKLSVKSSKFSLIPKSLFEQNDIEKYLQFNCSVDTSNERLFYKSQKSIDAINIFSAEEKIIQFFKGKYPNKELVVMHETIPFIEGVLSESIQETSRSVYIDIEQDHIQIVIINNKKLEYSNIFYYTTPDDLAYYVMYVFNEFHLNPEETITTIWGDIDEDSLHVHKLYKYIKNLHLGERPNNLHFSFHFDEIEDQKFFSLYNIHRCD